MADPGLSLRSTTLAQAWQLLRGQTPGENPSGSVPEAAEASDAIEALAFGAGLRSRRVLLEGRWWKEGGNPMIARVADRRRVPRGQAPVPHPALADGTGWVALIPGAGGFRMRAVGEDGKAAEWRVDEANARRLSPFAFTFHRRFEPRPLGAADMLRFVAIHGGRDLIVLALAGLAAGIVGLFTPLATGWLIDHVIPAGSLGSLQAIVLGLGVAGLAIIALEVLRSLAVIRFESRVAVSMQAALVDRVISAPARFFRDFSSGDLALRMGSVNTIQRTLTGSTIATFVTSLFLFSNLALMIMYSPSLTLAASTIVVIVIGVSSLIGLARLRVGPQIEALDGKLSSMQFEIFSGVAKLRASAAEPRALARWYERYDEFRRLNGVGARLANWESVGLNLLQPLATILVLWLAWREAATSPMPTGQFVAFHAALFSLLGGVHMLVSTALDLVNLKPVWDRARPILAATPEDASGGDHRHDPTGAIELAKVSFAYPGGPPVLNDIDLAVRPGEFVAIVGDSGVGKSTLLNCLAGLDTWSAGSIHHGDIDLSALDATERALWRRAQLGFVFQAFHVLPHLDVAQNVALPLMLLGGGPQPERVQAMLQAVGLAGLGLRLPQQLSGGQLQRVALARALVHRPALLLADEPTGNLDPGTAARVLELLVAQTREHGASLVLATHSQAAAARADRVLHLTAGGIRG